MNISTPLILSCISLLTLPLSAITMVLDFNDAGQANTSFQTADTTDIVTDLDITGYGLDNTAQNYAMFTNLVLEAVKKDYHFDLGIATGDSDLNGMQLDIDFVIGDYGVAPSNGDNDYHVMQIGTHVSGSDNENILGHARENAMTNAFLTNGSIVGTIFSDRIANLYDDSVDGIDEAINLLAGTISHEIGHTLGLRHVDPNSPYVTPNNLVPLMSSGLDADRRKNDREIANSALLLGSSAGTQMHHIDDLVAKLETRAIAVPEPSSTLLLGLGSIGFLLRRRR